MAKRAKVRRIERLERYLVQIIQEPGADENQPLAVQLLLVFLSAVSILFRCAVELRRLFYSAGILRRYPLGCLTISVGNVTAGGTGKTPVVEIFARTLRDEGRKVAILSRGYRRKEQPFLKRLFSRKAEPPRVVSDGEKVLLNAELGGDEPYMLATNLPGVCVIVDRNRVKAGRYAVRKFGCDTLILDDGFQYRKLLHSVEVCLVDKTNPVGNGRMLPRGILREPASALSRADYIFITKSNGDSAEVRELVRSHNKKAEIIECRHAPRVLRGVYSKEELPLEWIAGKTLATLSGIAVPQGFENSLRHLGARVVYCGRYADHHRYAPSEIADALNRARDFGCHALLTTEKDAVRFPPLENVPVPVYFLRVDIEILAGMENFRHAVSRIVRAAPRGGRAG